MTNNKLQIFYVIATCLAITLIALGVYIMRQSHRLSMESLFLDCEVLATRINLQDVETVSNFMDNCKKRPEAYKIGF